MLRTWIVGCLLGGFLAAWPAGGAPRPYLGKPIIVRLRPAVTVRDFLVRVDTVATLQGGDANLRQEIAKLDLADLPLEATGTTITQEDVTYRIQLAGFDPARFRVLGPAATQLTLAPPELTEESVLAVAKKLIRQRLPGQAVIHLNQPVYLPYLSIRERDRVRLEARLPSYRMPVGQVPVEVAIFVNGEARSRVRIMLNVSVLPTTPQAPRKIDPAVAGSKVSRG